MSEKTETPRLSLRFDKDGTFRILQLADTQQSPKVSLDTVRLIDALVQATRPHLVVYTGDQLKGNGSGFRRNAAQSMAETVDKITAPVRRRRIPFAVTFGNHDGQVEVSRAGQRDIYTRLAGCLMPANGPDPGTFGLTVRSADGKTDAMAIYLVDSGDGSLGHYHPVLPEQFDWLQSAHTRLCRQTGGTVPGIVFQHIPVPEFYDLLLRQPYWTRDAVVGVIRRKGFFVLNTRICRMGGVLSEAPSIPDENSGEFDALLRTPGIFALFCGHDHRNTFSGKVKGIELGYSPSCGFDAYGAGINRGGRLFVFQENDPADFKTRIYTYKELVGRRTTRPVRNAIDSVIPANLTEVKQSIANIALSVLLWKGLKKLGLHTEEKRVENWLLGLRPGTPYEGAAGK